MLVISRKIKCLQYIGYKIYLPIQIALAIIVPDCSDMV